MSGPGPTPAAGNVIPPPLFNFPWVKLKDGMLTVQAISQLTQFWALVVGEDGVAQNVQILFDMHGDATISATGQITVTATNGVTFGYFATGTNASQLTGTIATARYGANTIPFGALQVGLGYNMVIAGGDLTQVDPQDTVAGLPAPTKGLRAFVTDSNVAAAGNFGAVVAGGGANFVPVYADGGNWRIG